MICGIKRLETCDSTRHHHVIICDNTRNIRPKTCGNTRHYQTWIQVLKEVAEVDNGWPHKGHASPFRGLFYSMYPTIPLDGAGFFMLICFPWHIDMHYTPLRIGIHPQPFCTFDITLHNVYQISPSIASHTPSLHINTFINAHACSLLYISESSALTMAKKTSFLFYIIFSLNDCNTATHPNLQRELQWAKTTSYCNPI